MITEYILKLNILESSIGNAILQAAIFEVIMVLLIPLLGMIVNDVIVRGIRKFFQGLLGAKIEYALANYVLFIGVVIHELSHALFAVITGAKITELALFKPEGDSLGHVNFVTRGPAGMCALQKGLSSCAPVVMGFFLCSLAFKKLFPVLSEAWQWIVVIYVLISIIFHMNMSKADLKLYFKGVGLLAVIALPFSFLYFFFA